MAIDRTLVAEAASLWKVRRRPAKIKLNQALRSAAPHERREVRLLFKTELENSLAD